MAQTQPIPALPPIVSIVIGADGRTQVSCQVPKTEAVKLLLSVVEELRLQGYREESRMIQLAAPAQPLDR